MVRRLAAFALGGSVLLLAPGLAFAQTAACTQLTATGHPEYPPVGYQDGTAIDGVGADLVTEIAGKLNVPITVADTGTWDEAQQATRTGAADVIFGIYYNDDRATYLDYVQPPFMVDPVVVIVRNGEDFTFAGQGDLVGKHGVTNAGESYGVDFDAFMEQSLTVDRADGVDAVFNQLLSGGADYAIIGLYPAMAEATVLGITDQIHVLEPTLLSENMYVAFSKVSPCGSLGAQFGTEIQADIDNGHMQALIDAAQATWNAAHMPAGAPATPAPVAPAPAAAP